MADTPADYESRLQQTVLVAVNALRETPRSDARKAFVKGTRSARPPFDRLAHIRALADLVDEASYQLREELTIARDPAQTAPQASYAAIGTAAGITRQAVFEQVGNRRARRSGRGPLPLGVALASDDEGES